MMMVKRGDVMKKKRNWRILFVFGVINLLMGISIYTWMNSYFPKHATYTADSTYRWLKDSGLIVDEIKATSTHNAQGVIKTIETEHVRIIQYQTGYKKPKFIPIDPASVSGPLFPPEYKYGDVELVFLGGEGDIHDFFKVMEHREALPNLERTYLSKEEKQFVVDVKSGKFSEFLPFVVKFYQLPRDEQLHALDYLRGHSVTWKGVVVDGSMEDLSLYAQPLDGTNNKWFDHYKSWETPEEINRYVVNVRMPYNNGFNYNEFKGKEVTLQGKIENCISLEEGEIIQ